MRLGLNIGYSRSKLGIDLSLVQQADRLGFHSVWSAEAYGSDAVSPLCWIAAQTPRIKVGTAIMQIPARPPTPPVAPRASGGRRLAVTEVYGPPRVRASSEKPPAAARSRARLPVALSLSGSPASSTMSAVTLSSVSSAAGGTSAQPAAEARAVLPRPGQVLRLDLPIQIHGEVNGTTRRRLGDLTKDLGGLELELASADRSVVRRVRTAFDGFFEIRNLPPGTYTLRVSPEETQRLRLSQAPQRTFVVDAEHTIHDGQDLLVELPDEGDENPSQPPDAPPPPTPPGGRP